MNVTAQPEQYLLELRILMSRIIAGIIGLVRKLIHFVSKSRLKP